MSQIPSQKPSEDTLHSQLLSFSRRQQLLHIPQTDDYFLEDRFYEFNKVVVGDLPLFTASSQQSLIAFGKHFSNAAFYDIDGNIFLVIILQMFLLRLLFPLYQILALNAHFSCFGYLQYLRAAFSSLLLISHQIRASNEYKGGQGVCFIDVH